MKKREVNHSIRNVAIIAHVDHGKTTLVDQLLAQSGTFNLGDNKRIMDSLDLERERGITIAAKNCAVYWKEVKINILDTPGHADFGGEVERALQMVDGAILLVDASEGPLPQTRFVLRKALGCKLPIIVVINKIDRQDARCQEVLNEIYDLFIDLDASEEQIEFPVLYAIARQGIAKKSLDSSASDLSALFDEILATIPPPSYESDEPFRMLVSNIGYSDYLGRLAIGKVVSGAIRTGDSLVCIKEGNKCVPMKLSSAQVYHGLKFETQNLITAGEIAILSGAEDVEIGDTICNKAAPSALKRISVDEPTISMLFTINSSPFSGQEGTYVQSTRIAERLFKETLHNVALRVEEGEASETFIVKGRGEFQMAILIETMRREGFELSVGRPKIIFREKDGQTLEPIEHLFIDCEDVYTGIITEKLSLRKGRMINLVNHGSGRVRLEFTLPSRSLIGYRSEFLTDTKGTGIMNSILSGYEPFRGDFPTRASGSLVSDRQGEAIPYALFHLLPRGRLFVRPGERVYEGMVIGEHNRDNDLFVNPCKTKKLTNVRASGRDDSITLPPIQPLTLEQAIEFINDDEWVEVTPKNIRMRKIKRPPATRG
ncbi:MAG: translational GTPase TypA [Deltaproteobacteria bacterium]|nr:translational GTPase TypA [Deltaproteobacteria bacterium]